ncbi:hypothetical protein C8R46DRAFT_1208700 [Mycena filopes]|nr:hypothetical protein C8R46DRAFT_1208700 [Mycena filopes]
MPQVISNRTIDDVSGDSVTGALPTYIPASSWRPGSTCPDCKVHPNASLAFDHTWHDNSQLPGRAPVSLSLDFVGTAIYVFCIVPAIQDGVVSRYSLNFSLDDGASQGTFLYIPTSSTDLLYNVSVVSLPSLDNKAHNLLVSTDDSVNGSIFLFDYAVYTTVEGEDPPSHSRVGTIAGCVFGGIFILVVILALLVYRRKRRNQNRPVLPVVRPFPQDPLPEPKVMTPPSIPASTDASTATLVQQLQQVLDTVASLRQTTSEASPTATPVSAVPTYTAGSESQYESPPPLYRSRSTVTVAKS